MIQQIMIGNIGRDAVVNDVNGKKVINFNVAHSEKYKDANGTAIEKTMWVHCAWWTDRTTIAQYLKKGTQIFVQGHPDVRTYKDNSGATQAQMNLRVSHVQLLGGKKENNTTTNSTVTRQESGAIASSFNDGDLVDDLPF